MAQIKDILVVDDDPIFLSVTESVLETIGDYNIFTAADGRQALDILRTQGGKIDIIFLDLNMPNFDGIVALRALAESKFDGEIIIASGESQSVIESARKLAALQGLRVADIVKKPLIPSDAVNALKACRGRQALQCRPDLPGYTRFEDLPKFAPQYQVQVETKSWRACSAEALLRVQTDDGHQVNPRDFLNAIKSKQLKTEVAFRMVEKVFADAAWITRHAPQFRLAVNLDAEILEFPEATDILVTLAKRTTAQPRNLVIELTEAQMPKDPSRLVESLSRLRMNGFHISMDDFGTGGSNYELLRMCPFTEIKLDRGIVQGAMKDTAARNFLEMTKSIARELDLDLVAEGVETRQQLKLLRSYGVNRYQGYLFGKATTPKALIDNDLPRDFEAVVFIDEIQRRAV